MLVQYRALHLADDVHFAGLAVKAQRQFFFAIDQLQRLGLDRALHANHALGLFGAQTHGKTHAVLGDHQADFTFFFLALIRSINHLDAMLDIEVMRFLVENVGQVGQCFFGESHRWLYGLGAGQAHKAR